MVEPLTTTVIISLFFSEAVKEGGKALGKGATNTFLSKVQYIYNISNTSNEIGPLLLGD